MQEMDRFSAVGSFQCHRCAARKGDFSSADFRGRVKSTAARRAAMARSASGVDLPEIFRGAKREAVVLVVWEDDGKTHSPGPNSAHYGDARK